MAKLTAKERVWIGELQAVLDRCPSPKKIGAGFDESIDFPSAVESTAG
ncbi:hypothetical protein MNZ66_004654 [Salmonella enterica]|nr:hypothetical protein [Salmonella enterica]